MKKLERLSCYGTENWIKDAWVILEAFLSPISLGLLIILLATIPTEQGYSEPGVSQSELLGGWPGTYTGTGTVVRETWSTFFGESQGIEAFSEIDTTFFEAPVILTIEAIDSTHVTLLVQFEGFGWGVDPSYERMTYSNKTLNIDVNLSLNYTEYLRFRQTGTGTRAPVTGRVVYKDHFDGATIHSSLTISISVVKDMIDTAVREDHIPAQAPGVTLYQNSPILSTVTP